MKIVYLFIKKYQTQKVQVNKKYKEQISVVK